MKTFKSYIEEGYYKAKIKDPNGNVTIIDTKGNLKTDKGVLLNLANLAYLRPDTFLKMGTQQRKNKMKYFVRLAASDAKSNKDFADALNRVIEPWSDKGKFVAESLDELSTNTLNSYEKKARRNAIGNALKFGKKAHNKYKRRERGLRRAAKKTGTQYSNAWRHESTDLEEGIATDLLKDLAKIFIGKKSFHALKRAKNADKYKAAIQQLRSMRAEVRKLGGPKQFIAKHPEVKGINPGMLDQNLISLAASNVGLKYREFLAVLDKKTRYEDSSNREWGTDSLTDVYKKDTPGQ